MPPPLSAHEIADLLVEFGRRTDLANEPFKARAYYVAAENLRAHSVPITELIAANKVKTIPGVGEAIAEKIIRLHKTGAHPTLDFLREQHPAGLLEMFEIPGLGVKKIEIIHSTLKLSTLAELEAACKAGQVAACKGLGKALEAKILKGLEMRAQNQGALLADAAELRLTGTLELLRKSPDGFEALELAGDVRRGCEVANGLALAGSSKRAAPAVNLPPDITLSVSAPERFGVTLLYATGSEAHLQLLAERAGKHGLQLSARGLFRGDTEIECRSEAQIYEALKLPFIPPELREGAGEIEAAQKNALPKLVELSDIRGILHSHTTFSDGVRSLADMAEAVRKRGYEYYGVADHSKSAAYAGGMKEDRIVEQQKMADELNTGYAKRKFRIFKGIESDILVDGSLDYPDEFLARFDFIVASIHSRFSLGHDEQTARLIKAVSHPRTTILGHMTGRKLLSRDGYDIDIEAVLKACAAHGVAVEINAHPARLDLDWRWHQRALELGCMLSINPDAHDISEIDLVKYGVNVARKGGVPANKVLNCLTLDEITAYFEKRKRNT
jgi:DNA polymerase (family 10)